MVVYEVGLGEVVGSGVDVSKCGAYEVEWRAGLIVVCWLF